MLHLQGPRTFAAAASPCPRGRQAVDFIKEYQGWRCITCAAKQARHALLAFSHKLAQQLAALQRATNGVIQ